METIDAIMTRRSIRDFQDKPVPKDIIKKLLAAAMNAPSAANQQSWQFVVVTDKKLLKAVPEFSPYAAPSAKAAAGILVCGDLNKPKLPELWVQDCSAATQNILLAAHSLGLGAVWTGVYGLPGRAEGFVKLLDLPEKIVPLSFVVFGYPSEAVPPETRYSEKLVHYNKW
jgi:Nitroreductase